MNEFESLTPKAIVEELDRYIIGQTKAKRACAVALRNRTRRLKLSPEAREEIAPKNILMIGPTGVGKTEIARRLAKLSGAPFIKVEATKYTEVGYVGRDVESMIRDLMAVGYAMVKSEMQTQLRAEAEKRAEEALLDLLLPGFNKKGQSSSSAELLPSLNGPEEALSGESFAEASSSADSSTREKFRKMLRDGLLEERVVEIQVQKTGMPAFEVFAGSSNLEDLEMSMANITNLITGGRNKRKSVSVRDAREIIIAEQLDKLVDQEKIADEARNRVEQMGIVFIDEIDKIAVGGGGRSGGQDVSREGVQRDILPIVEGSKVNTKYGVVDTTHILFIAAGAFSISRPSDLIPELQGRFPLRVELESLHAEDFKRILLEPKNALTRQYIELLGTENVTISFSDDAIERMSFLAAEVNSRMENIGARRLHTILEMLLEEISFNASEMSGQAVDITAAYVDERLKDIVLDQDLSRYIL
ncbi:ATP-dependent protease ATPase subunit HslU [Treponema zuelzerae]|uniref:ATP-dependent protease ATPase subunit HslU n=1 Tax=Teretinema zuelzerae TaxID=156 RepID=A0AAE3EEY4_9SPIR|nr:ATP-dependent protease ATPase subunit HslU [Teretinema zuelzerae]MCD1653244.1 ATP-dependent protease ATPase subunit HslU [Teretinema zuelzerae]